MAESFCFPIVSDEFCCVILSPRNQNEFGIGNSFVFCLQNLDLFLGGGGGGRGGGNEEIFPKFDLDYRIFCFNKLMRNFFT